MKCFPRCYKVKRKTCLTSHDVLPFWYRIWFWGDIAHSYTTSYTNLTMLPITFGIEHFTSSGIPSSLSHSYSSASFTTLPCGNVPSCSSTRGSLFSLWLLQSINRRTILLFPRFKVSFLPLLCIMCEVRVDKYASALKLSRSRYWSEIWGQTLHNILDPVKGRTGN